ncbi:MAG: caspase family protein [Treponema sp.]|jgi:hypothetical protein|nr:caspase family protein [Treponema sp.]
MMNKKIAVTGLLVLLVFNGLSAAEEAMPSTRRFGIFIGSNNGGRDRVMLRYAVSDAKSVSRVFTGMGGIADGDNILLVEPSVREINRQLDTFGRLSSQSKQNAQRTELVFYYSGHSDENGILLNRERYGYRELRERINAVQTDMRIVILDSCSSGAITRAKGGVKTQPFLFDSSVSTTGYAFLTSSSDTETSQESDSIESSYFTHSLLAGLRGAADSVGDGRVTLNELYRFAYTETLARTETSIFGAQHPSYDIQISGSGDVVLTDIKEISASLFFADELTGRVSIRDSSDFLIAELTKIANKPLELGLEPGSYRITLQRGDNFYRTEINLSENQRAKLDMGNFQLIAASSGNRNRGDNNENAVNSASEAASNNNDHHHPFSLQIVPGIDITGSNRGKVTNNVLIALIAGRGYNIDGIGAAGIGLTITGNTHGPHASGIFNTVEGSVEGAQAAGIFNKVQGTVTGAQAAGIFNLSEGSLRGVQAAGIFNRVQAPVTGAQAAGIFNMDGGAIEGVQAVGIMNITEGTVRGVQAAGIFNYAAKIQGIQAAGIMNVNRGGGGVMFGLINKSDSENIFPVGLINIIKNGILHPAVFVDDMLFTNFSLRSGSKHFYYLLSTGVGGRLFYNRTEDTYLTTRAGFGFEIPIKKAFINIDLTSGSIYSLGIGKWTSDDASASSTFTDSQIHQLRLTFGYKFFEHLGVFSGISYDYLHKWRNNSPNPENFGGVFVGGTYGRHVHKLGFFGGIQF